MLDIFIFTFSFVEYEFLPYVYTEKKKRKKFKLVEVGESLNNHFEFCKFNKRVEYLALLR